MYAILDDIKNNRLKKAYLLYGEEQYLVKLYKDKLIKACLGKSVREAEGDMNFTGFSGSGQDPLAVSECIRTLPFFAEKRVVLLEGTGWFKKTPEGAAEVFGDIPESTCVIITESEVDKRTAAYKAVEKAGHIANFEKQKDEDLRRWICREVEKNGKKITVKAVDTLIKATDSNMAALETEIEKLSAYCMEKEAIDKTDVDLLVHMNASDRVFDMISLMATGKRREALLLYYDLLERREAPMKILSLMERQFRILIAVKEMRTNGVSQKEIERKLGLFPKAVAQSIEQAEYFSHDDLVAILQKAAEYDMASKRGGITDRMAVELLLVDISGE